MRMWTIAKRIALLGIVPVLVLAAVIAVALVSGGLPRHAQAQSEPARVAFDHDLVVEEREVVHGDVSVTNGKLIVRGQIEGKASVLNGNVEVYGKVLGDVAVLTGGSVTIYPGGSVGGNILASGDVSLMSTSTVGGSVTSLGGVVRPDAGASVHGPINTVQNPAQTLGNFVAPVPAQTGKPEAMLTSALGRITGLFGLGILSLMMLMLAAGMAALMPSRVRTASITLNAEPAPSIVVGVITGAVMGLMLPAVGLVLAITIVGLVLLPVLLVFVLAVALFGFVIASHWLGRRVHDSVRQSPPTAGLQFHPQTVVVEVVLGAAVIIGSTLVPVLFLPAWMGAIMLMLLLGVSAIGFGAAVLSRFGTLAPPKRHYRHMVVYPNAHHEHYESAHGPSHGHAYAPAATSGQTGPVGAPAPVTVEHGKTRPLGPLPTLPRQD